MEMVFDLRIKVEHDCCNCPIIIKTTVREEKTNFGIFNFRALGLFYLKNFWTKMALFQSLKKSHARRPTNI